jgi:hypothetical protein
VYLQADGDLRTATHAMNSVTDGAVTNGQEEYGVKVIGALGYDTNVDRAVSSTQRVIGQSSSASAVIGDRVGMIYKLATNYATPAGAYSQAVYYTLTANY